MPVYGQAAFIDNARRKVAIGPSETHKGFTLALSLSLRQRMELISTARSSITEGKRPVGSGRGKCHYGQSIVTGMIAKVTRRHPNEGWKVEGGAAQHGNLADLSPIWCQVINRIRSIEEIRHY